ncbi:hypothetical protein E2542_SST10518 [Spatholobus suberectus]|nr:hypothetical protein E2542_SST10518 [Spatholobus suberectus]
MASVMALATTLIGGVGEGWREAQRLKGDGSRGGKGQCRGRRRGRREEGGAGCMRGSGERGRQSKTKSSRTQCKTHSLG